MKTYMCDRCRSFYCENASIKIELGDKEYKGINVSYYSGFGFEQFDLCPGCRNSLAEWLKGGEVE